MSTIAIQISASGLSWAALPDPLDLDGGNAVRNHVVRWPRLRDYPGGRLPHDMAERLETFAIIAGLVEEADRVILAVEPGADGRRVGIAEVTLEAVGCHVQEDQPHRNQAAGLIWDVLEEIIETSPRPPGM